MKHLKIKLFTFFFFLLACSGNVQAFSFDFGDNDDFHPYWGPAYNPWIAPNPWGTPPPYRFYRQLPSFDRSSMVQRRQRVMSNHDDSMTRLKEQLYGRDGFDRAEAIKLARKIELTSGAALTGNFHPGAVADYHSRTTPAYWGNEQAFTANAQALQAAARDLAIELGKQPTAEEGAVMLPKRSYSYTQQGIESEAVSPAIWEKFNTMSTVCEGCHRQFRGASRW